MTCKNFLPFFYAISLASNLAIYHQVWKTPHSSTSTHQQSNHRLEAMWSSQLDLLDGVFEEMKTSQGDCLYKFPLAPSCVWKQVFKYAVSDDSTQKLRFFFSDDLFLAALDLVDREKGKLFPLFFLSQETFLSTPGSIAAHILHRQWFRWKQHGTAPFMKYTERHQHMQWLLSCIEAPCLTQAGISQEHSVAAPHSRLRCYWRKSSWW